MYQDIRDVSGLILKYFENVDVKDEGIYTMYLNEEELQIRIHFRFEVEELDEKHEKVVLKGLAPLEQDMHHYYITYQFGDVRNFFKFKYKYEKVIYQINQGEKIFYDAMIVLLDTFKFRESIKSIKQCNKRI